MSETTQKDKEKDSGGDATYPTDPDNPPPFFTSATIMTKHRKALNGCSIKPSWRKTEEDMNKDQLAVVIGNKFHPSTSEPTPGGPTRKVPRCYLRALRSMDKRNSPDPMEIDKDSVPMETDPARSEKLHDSDYILQNAQMKNRELESKAEKHVLLQCKPIRISMHSLVPVPGCQCHRAAKRALPMLKHRRKMHMADLLPQRTEDPQKDLGGQEDVFNQRKVQKRINFQLGVQLSRNQEDL
ncbi:hypothetical protein B9Z55_026009 [Caenorhabditis nigoni]|uniref:Uncharacterized protein n=1 Tax=Caenorhabditis nigoni TaxID=1611254 RepID=A0A2G5T1J6_9PELO|nr:hypothetical protein B9Z55_026009 [Caenorhabditis nigoni]